jgi:hypothetical protein
MLQSHNTELRVCLDLNLTSIPKRKKSEELACAYFENRFLTIRAAIAETRNSTSNGIVVNSGTITPLKVNVRGLCGEGSDPK